MLSEKTKNLINLAILNLQLENPTQDIINKAITYLKEAITQMEKEREENNKIEDKNEYKVWLYNALYDVECIENTFFNTSTGKVVSINNKYKTTDYIEIPTNISDVMITMPISGISNMHVGGFFDENKNYLYGIANNSNNSNVKYDFNNKDMIQIHLEGNEKYLILSSASSGDLCSAYYITTYKAESEKIFHHESNETYTVNTVLELKSLNAKTGDSVITKGYYYTGDNGEAIYDIITYDEFSELLPKDIKIMFNASDNTYIRTPVDEYGNHTLSNGLVAKLRLNGEVKPEQFGAKGDGKTNDCKSFVHMFAQIKSGKIIFRENSNYIIGMINEGETVTSYKDNPYKSYMCGGLLGGQAYGKPIMANIKDVEFEGNNAQISLQDGMFGSGGMGIFNFGGEIDGLKIHDLRFDGKGRTVYSPNKNTNHTLFYAPSTFYSNSTLIKDIHPLYNKETDSFSSGYFKNVEINNCNFFDAGAMYKKAGDWGGDFILIINPSEMDNVNIHHNRFEAWGRWVFAVDLGGYGECMTNIKFNDNICIGANACEYNKDNYQVIKNEDNSLNYMLPVPKEILKKDPSTAQNSLSDIWRWRALGFIDFEAKKCWKNIELQRNSIIGTAGWAINGNSRVSENFLIKDNIWFHQGGGYPYLMEFYSGFSKDWIIENNIIPVCGARIGITTENVTIRGNKGNVMFRTHGLQGDIIIEDNKKLTNDIQCYHRIFSLEGTRKPDYLPENIEQKAKIVFRNNEFGLTGGLNYNVPYLEFDIHNNKIDWIEIQNFYHLKLGANDFSNYVNGTIIMYGFQDLSPEELNNNTLYPFGFYYEEGDIICSSLKNSKLAPKGSFFSNYILTPEQKEIAVGNWKSYQSLIGREINGVKYNDYKIVCTKSGIIPQCGCWGFRNQMTGYEDLIKNKNKLQDNAYVYYKDNLYRNIGATGEIDAENPPVHTQGVATCGEVELEFVDKLGMAKLIGIE